jgi:hypothetical protein
MRKIKQKIILSYRDAINETNELLSKYDKSNLGGNKHLEDFKSNLDVRKAISGKFVLSDYSQDEILKIYVSLKRANAPLKYLCEQLEFGIPAKFKPKSINGRRILETSGEGMNCLIYALIKISGPKEWRWKREKEVTRIRKILVSERLAGRDEFLDLNELGGKRVIDELTDNRWFDPSRGLLVYQLNRTNMRMRCDEKLSRTEENPDKPYYALFLWDEAHFEAMSEPERE